MYRFKSALRFAAIVLGIVVVGSGCSTPRVNSGVIQVSPGTYMIATSGHFTTDLATLKQVVFRDANVYAKAQNKVMIPISTKEVEKTMSRNPSFELQFRLGDPQDTKAAGVHLTPRPDLSVEVKSSNVTQKQVIGRSDLEDRVKQLERLAALKQQGVLTEAEFQEAKRKILDQIK